MGGLFSIGEGMGLGVLDGNDKERLGLGFGGS